MEQDLNEFNDYSNFENYKFYRLEYKNQEIKNKKEFKKWYESAKNYVRKVNFKKEAHNLNDFLTIEFCDNCLSYTICSIKASFSYVECTQCKENFCIGCSRKRIKFSDISFDETTCLKGYLKSLYLRIIYRRSDFETTYALLNILHIFFCLFLTPLYLCTISSFLALLLHPNKKRILKQDYLEKKMLFASVYSIIRGILMFPYIIIFFPFMVILLLPGIFSYKYYIYIFMIYATAICPSIIYLEINENN